MRRKVSEVEGTSALLAWQHWHDATSVTAVSLAIEPSRDPASGSTGGARAAVAASPGLPRATLATAVRYTLEEFGTRHPGGSVEIRIPPLGVVQAIAGVRHTRGTPPAIIETTPHTWLELATGSRTWGDAVTAGLVNASGERADLTERLPIFTLFSDAAAGHTATGPAEPTSTTERRQS